MGNIVLSASKENVLTKLQQQFNKLVNSIEKEKKNIERETKKYDEILAEYNTKVLPQIPLLVEKQFEFAKKIDAYTFQYKLSKSQIKKVKTLICALMDEVFSNAEGTKEQIKLYDKWSDTKYEEEKKESFEELKDDFKNIFEQATGETIDMSDFDESPEGFAKFNQRLEEKMKERNENFQKSVPPRKKSKKQLEKEKREQQIEEMKSKNLRSIYVGLAKLLHPDTEIDEILKAEKEELMKQVTDAYNKQDLITLLKLEIEWVYKNNNNIHTLKDEVLSIYCDVLKQQLGELQHEKYNLKQNPRYENILKQSAFGLYTTVINPTQELTYLQNEIEVLSIDAKKIEALNGESTKLNILLDYFMNEYIEEETDEFDDILEAITFRTGKY
jgi:hypothetical protein